MGKEYGEGTLGVGVLDATSGEQPHLWSEVQADVPYDPEEPWEGDEVPGVEGKLVMAVLSSVKGWPYASFSENKIRKEKMRLLGGHSTECDAYIRRSNWRVWNIVKECLDEWVEGRRGGYPHNFTVNGTLGIGKSFATGSLLLYQLLHYPSEWLKVVAYFVRGKAYIFHREDRRVVYYKKEEVAVDEIEEMVSKGVEGYIIYDMCGGRDSIHSLPDKWGVVLLTYAKSSNYERWSEERYGGTSPIYVDCYDDVEFMAVLTWERHMQGPDGLTPMNRTGNILEDWEMLRNRIYKVGPVPRYVLKGEVTFNSRACTVNNSVKRLSYADLDDFMWRLKNVTEWPINDARYEMVIQIRTSGHITDDCTSHIISSYVWQELLLIILRHFCETEVQESELHSGGERCARTRETLGVTVFLIRSVSDVMVRHLKHLPREGETERSCTSVLARVSAWGRVPSRTSFLAKEDRDLSLQSDKLYRPLFQNFPVVDGFFLVDAVGERVGVSLPEGAAAPTQTIVLIQVTRARDHHTTTSKVEAFRKRMAKYFTNWTEMESRLSYEIIYVQHADSTTLTGRQRCARSGVANDAGNERFWSGIHQFCVKLDAPIAKLLFKDIYGAELIEEAGAPVATETRIKRRRVEDVAATV
ncbi:unnamed protein product [Trypanosoma congolense IL3000]|uniref:WGS project CAEQ00000000 data, annotated contig 410 n=1 Tax=Trypanosoma congolense (strain IL3000) TaxID=1068625 RepID=F9WFN9_TRYCI|nr:unnamed protein product [Trypanosoma congolense IL3000]